MRAQNKSKWFAMIFLVFLTSFPVFVGFYFADPGNNVFFSEVRDRKAGANLKKESRTLQGRVHLLKDSSLTINITRLVYKGLEDKHILLEYYLLELDPDFSYQNRLTAAEARSGIRLGDSVFRLVSVSRNLLKLQIVDLYRKY